MNNLNKIQQIQAVIQEWDSKKGHNRCWFYPELFQQIAKIVEVPLTDSPILPPKEEFEACCEKYKEEQYSLPNTQVSEKEKHEQFPENEIVHVTKNIFIHKNRVWFNVANQYFALDAPNLTEEETIWFAQQFSKALDNYFEQFFTCE